jgi:mannose-1-phosphate guanylyltransferase/mannose-6-phosphate isomerase
VQNKTTRRLIPVILSGGSGTRLWPLSRESRPKQFLPLVSSTTLFQETLRRTQRLHLRVDPPLVVSNAAHRHWVAEQSREIGIAPHAIVLEPAGRNTAAAVAVAALLATAASPGVRRSANEALLLVLPADHVIADSEAFARAISSAVEAAGAGRLVTFGVVPDKPETGYGYILCGEQHGAWSTLGKFVEKPDLATAESYVKSGQYLWNSGMFLFSAAAFLEELRTHEPAILEACERAVADAVVDDEGFTRLGAAFLDSPSKSIDYAVMEKTHRGAVVPLAAGWSDVGSWSALHDVLARDAQGNAVVGDAMLEGCTNTYVAATGRLVAAIGLDNVVIVETDDAVLVLHRDRAQDVKGIVDELKAQRRTELLEGTGSKLDR